jgi:hypothetical protein
LNEHDELFDEGRLRRALRLETSEIPPRLDAAAIVASAGASHPERVAASFVSAVVAGGAGALLLTVSAGALTAVAPALAGDLWGVGLRAFASAAVWASWPLGLALDPTVPMATLTALAVAVAYEYAQRRERVRAVKPT